MSKHNVWLEFLTMTTIVVLMCHSTPLDDYVNAADPHFAWNILMRYDQPDYTLYILNFTSQKWLDDTYVSRSIWWHYLCINIPHKLVRSATAYLLIDGGDNTDSIPKPEDSSISLMSMLAVSTGSITVNLQDVPNVPIKFTADPTNQSHNDNAAVAWTWKLFLENPSNPAMLLFLPMTKASVRAMDVVQQFTMQCNFTVPETFVIGGASKRGWTAWTTAAVDQKRVIGATPIVMDMLNLQKSFHHHYRSLIGWSFVLKDFYAVNIFRYLDTQNFTQMSSIIDPYVYMDRYKSMKILQLQTTGDEFFLLDNEDTFWQDLQRLAGETYLRRIPNAEHQCIGHLISILLTIRSFYLSIYEKQRLPSFQWTKTTNRTHGFIRAIVDVQNGPKPIDAVGYRAHTLNANRRDFRLAIANPDDPTQPFGNPVFWFTTPLITDIQNQTTIAYSLTIENPINGWEGFFIQINFPGPDGSVLELTTETQIIPDTYPTGECSGDGCAGHLV